MTTPSRRCARRLMKTAGAKTLQGEMPLLFAAVDENVVAAVVADWTGIPLGRMVKMKLTPY